MTIAQLLLLLKYVSEGVITVKELIDEINQARGVKTVEEDNAVLDADLANLLVGLAKAKAAAADVPPTA